MVVHAFKPSTQEAETSTKFETSLVYIASSRIESGQQRKAVSLKEKEKEKKDFKLIYYF